MTLSVGSWSRFAASLIVGAAVLAGCGGGGGGGSGGTSPIAGPGPGGNTPPTITGTPAVAIAVGQQYTFQPQAKDPEGNPVTFAIASKPAWATFDAATGKLSGTPKASDVGVHEAIVISVSDGHATASLPKFSVMVSAAGTPIRSVSLGWDIPTENDDGTPLTDLTGFRIHYGSAAAQYSGTLEVSNATATQFVVQNLPEGTYYFAITAVNAAGVESTFSTEVNASI
jgi:hypothetical protein